MRKFVLTSALAFAALGFAAIDTAHAQVIINGGYSQGYYGGYSPGYYGGGIVPASGYFYNNSYNYGSYPSYPNYGTTYYPSYSGYSNSSPALSSYYSFYRRGSYSNNYNYNRRWR